MLPAESNNLPSLHLIVSVSVRTNALKVIISVSLVYPRAGGAKRRARVLIPPGYLHPGKRKH